MDKDGLLIDVDVQSVDSSPACTREDKQKDVDHFFHSAVVKIVKGKAKKYAHESFHRHLLSCLYTDTLYRGSISIIDQITTLHRHLEFKHKVSFIYEHICNLL